jgi:hypothetical protein
MVTVLPPIFDDQTGFSQLLFDPVGIGVFLTILLIATTMGTSAARAW